MLLRKKQQVLVTTNAVQKSKAVALLCGVVLSLSAFSQNDTTLPKTFIFSKYQLPAQSESPIAFPFYSAPPPPSPYKIHYKIKTLTFPADTRPERPTSIANAVVNGLVETATKKLFKDDCDEKNRFLVPLKPTNTFKY